MWTMDELVERVREALAAEYPGAPNGRVRDVPDRRAIRWYTTIGLVDRPLGMRGRTALYGPRHLEQLVAIKRRQAEGHTLAQIQAEFTWLTPQGLTDAAQVPERLLADGDPPPGHQFGGHRLRFWADTPAPAGSEMSPAALSGDPTAPPSDEAGHLPTGTAPQHGHKPTGTAPQHGHKPTGTAPQHGQLPTATAPQHARLPTGTAPRHGHLPLRSAPAREPVPPGATAASEAVPVHGVALGGGAILLLPRPVPDRDRADLAAAAAPLLDLLQSRGLIDGRSS